MDCIQSIVDDSTLHRKEIIVVDNGSSDDSVEAVRRAFPEVKLIENGMNLGFAKANNIGIEACSGHYVCLVNSDAKVQAGCIQALCGYLDSNPAVGIIGPRILNPDMTLQDSCRKFPSLLNNFFAVFGLNKIFPKSKILSAEQMLYFPHDRICRADYISGCFLMVRRSAIQEVGLLDERFFIYNEEVDWCKRFWDLGWEVVFFPGASAIHHHGASSSRDPLRFDVEMWRTRLLYWAKHYHGITWFAFLIIFVLHHSMRVLGGSLGYFISSMRSSSAFRVRRGLACFRLLMNRSNLTN